LNIIYTNICFHSFIFILLSKQKHIILYYAGDGDTVNPAVPEAVTDTVTVGFIANTANTISAIAYNQNIKNPSIPIKTNKIKNYKKKQSKHTFQNNKKLTA
jgi:hypothetical protein